MLRLSYLGIVLLIASPAAATDTCTTNFIKEAVADFCDVSAEGGGIDGMIYDTKTPCQKPSVVHLEGSGERISVSVDGKTLATAEHCPASK